jgi:GT2 family glycosyltransferase
MPFAGDRAAARRAVDALLALDAAPGDELILADNSGTARADPRVRVIPVPGERSPASARNAGAAHARNEWILFLDADCVPGRGLLRAYFDQPVGSDVGALAGEVVPAPEARSLAARYAAHKNFLGYGPHLAHPYRPRAPAANLLVRRAALERVGGFYEGVRAAEDTDFSWRLQAAGWRLEPRAGARVEHVYRDSVADLRRQWRGYAAGRAWLARRYEGFEPEPAVRRALTRVLARANGLIRTREPDGETRPRAVQSIGPLERGRFAALDALLGAEELAGLVLSNRPPRAGLPPATPARVVLVAERFPAREDPLVDFARTLEAARVEAAARPAVLDLEAIGELEVAYREDDGVAARAVAVARLIVRHPVRCLLDLAGRRAGSPGLPALAPAVMRLRRDAGARLHALGGEDARAIAARLAALAGRQLEP